MTKISIKEPDGPYGCVLDTKVADVIITEAFLGVGFETPAGEKLAVCMRDNGFEIRYCANGEDSNWIELKDGLFNVNLNQTV